LYLTDVSNQRLESEYEKASILVSIPWLEGFGLPVAEGIARNKIVVASDIPSHREFAELRNVYFVDPGNVEQLTDTLGALLKRSPGLTENSNSDFPGWKDYAQRIYRFLQE
jgi:glycosyltransferase involved in cell wall biosynthesis